MQAWRVLFIPAAEKQLTKLPLKDQERIAKYLRERVLTDSNPRRHAKALAGGDHFWRFRVGNYRLIAEIRDSTFVILLVKIAHRREVYR
jgi:mRNA interferase RelE/StbE